MRCNDKVTFHLHNHCSVPIERSTIQLHCWIPLERCTVEFHWSISLEMGRGVGSRTPRSPFSQQLSFFILVLRARRALSHLRIPFIGQRLHLDAAVKQVLCDTARVSGDRRRWVRSSCDTLLTLHSAVFMPVFHYLETAFWEHLSGAIQAVSISVLHHRTSGLETSGLLYLH